MSNTRRLHRSTQFLDGPFSCGGLHNRGTFCTDRFVSQADSRLNFGELSNLRRSFSPMRRSLRLFCRVVCNCPVSVYNPSSPARPDF